MKNKKAIEFSFAWIFAVIIGAFILFLAIYAATRVVSTGESRTATATAKETGILLNPLETGFEEGKSTLMTFPSETRIYNGCENPMPTNSEWFGSQQIQISQKSFGKFGEPGVPVSFENKYIFSNNYEQGRDFYIFSKPFDFPFKVADLIYLTSSENKYCFIDAPEKIKEEIEELGQENLLTDSGCFRDKNSVKVCFDSSASAGIDCDIKVKYNLGYLEKGGNRERFYFETDSLMYGAIFSDKEIYECQAKRLVKRAESLVLVYGKKANLLSQKSCNTNLDFASLSNELKGYEDSSDFAKLISTVNSMKGNNEIASCRLW